VPKQVSRAPTTSTAGWGHRGALAAVPLPATAQQLQVCSQSTPKRNGDEQRGSDTCELVLQVVPQIAVVHLHHCVSQDTCCNSCLLVPLLLKQHQTIIFPGLSSYFATELPSRDSNLTETASAGCAGKCLQTAHAGLSVTRAPQPPLSHLGYT